MCGVGPHRYFCQRTQSFSVDFDEGSRGGIARHHAAMLTKSYFYEGYRRENGSATCTLRRLPELSRIRVLLSKSSSTISFDFCHFSVKLVFPSITSTLSARDIQSNSMTSVSRYLKNVFVFAGSFEPFPPKGTAHSERGNDSGLTRSPLLRTSLGFTQRISAPRSPQSRDLPLPL